MNHLQTLAGIAAGMMIAAAVGLVMAAGIRARRIDNHARIHGADLWDRGDWRKG